jgi:DNA (cytosine-5)-methyltransferase 1
MNTKTKKIAVIDLFCGIGGLSYGLQQAGLNVVVGIDNDARCEYGYTANNKATFILDDIGNISSEKIKSLFGNAEITVLAGCAPCQPYSGLNQRGSSLEKMQPLEKFAKLIEETKPTIVSMENVRGLAREGKYPVFNKFIGTLKDNGYHINYQIINASDYGAPQNRVRLVLLASLLGPITLIEPTHQDQKTTVRETIGHLPPIEDGVRHERDSLHYTRKLNPLNKERIRHTPINGGNSMSWPDNLKLACHKKNSGKTYERSVYGRMKWDAPAPTMTTQCIGLGNGRFGHPEQNRAISLREAALIQTFPINYKFVKNSKKDYIIGDVARFIGNAVPPRLGYVIGESIKDHINTWRSQGAVSIR